MERVALTFYVDGNDVANGKVLWIWDFHGLKNPSAPSAVTYNINLTNVAWEKDYSTATRTEPYFDFANMTYKNMNIIPTYNSSAKIQKNTAPTGTKPTRYGTTVQGHNTAGLTRETGGRGTYVTNATTNSLLMQVEPVYYGWRYSDIASKDGDGRNITLYADQPWIGSEDEGIQTKYSTVNFDYSNPIVFNVPVKNVQPGKTYKVVFDFSIAKQGTTTIEETKSTTNSNAAFANYDDNLARFFSSDRGVALLFQSYFHNGIVNGYGIETTHAQVPIRGYYSYANKYKNQHWLTSYNDLTKASNEVLSTAISTNIKSSVNDISWHNATKRVENNGENSITWLTLENTSFTFNIDGYYVNGAVTNQNLNLDNLQWVWAIDMFAPTAWFRFKIDNVRFEEVANYGANIGSNTYAGVRIGDYEIANVQGLFNNASVPYRGSSGTGQTFLARGLSPGTELPALNIYSPIYDLKDWDKSIPSTQTTPIKNTERIYLSGWCVVDGGVDKYVWSADGGETWHDMIVEGALGNDIETGTNSIALQATQKINPCLKGNTSISPVKVFASVNGNAAIDFRNSDDGLNADFRGYKIYADLSEYKYEHDVDIIFAAVPVANPSLRCEILKLINYNYTRNYRTYTNEFISDIQTHSGGSANLLNAHHNTSDYTNVNGSETSDNFTMMYGVQANATKTISSAGGYARCTSLSDAYEDTRTLLNGMPIENTLKISAWAIVEGGVEKYMWTADYGQTWHDIDKSSTVSTTDIRTDQRYWWYDGIQASDDALDVNSSVIASITLTEYVGKNVDIILVAKPNGSNALCPVGRIDNVAVYGENGTFFSRVEALHVNGTSIECTKQHLDGTYLCRPGWKDLGLDGRTFSSLEPANVNIKQMRLYTHTKPSISGGQSIEIFGFVACHGGVSEYKYSIDNGKFQSISSTSVYTDDSQDLLEAARKVDSRFDNASNGVNGDFRSGVGKLVIDIPEGTKTGERDLLVVAVNSAQKAYPVLHLKINVT